MTVFVNKETFEVLTKRAFAQLVDDTFFNVVGKRLKTVEEELKETWVEQTVKSAVTRGGCSHTQCIYHTNDGCGAPAYPMVGCIKVTTERKTK